MLYSPTVDFEVVEANSNANVCSDARLLSEKIFSLTVIHATQWTVRREWLWVCCGQSPQRDWHLQHPISEFGQIFLVQHQSECSLQGVLSNQWLGGGRRWERLCSLVRHTKRRASADDPTFRRQVRSLFIEGPDFLTDLSDSEDDLVQLVTVSGPPCVRLDAQKC